MKIGSNMKDKQRPRRGNGGEEGGGRKVYKNNMVRLVSYGRTHHNVHNIIKDPYHRFRRMDGTPRSVKIKLNVSAHVPREAMVVAYHHASVVGGVVKIIEIICGWRRRERRTIIVLLVIPFCLLNPRHFPLILCILARPIKEIHRLRFGLFGLHET